MTFARPAALWLLLLLPLLAVYERRWGLWARARLKFPSLKILSGGLRPPTKEHFLAALRLAALGLMVIALARPQRGQTREEVTSPATDIMLVLDISDSMRSLDFKPRNRFQAAMEVLRQFIKDRSRDRLGLVVFARDAFTQCPLTLDHGALLGFLDNVRIGLVDPDRTAVGSALATATARLKASAAKSKIIVLLTDGRSNFGDVDPVTAAKAAAALGLRVHTVGAGAPGGGTVEIDHPFFGKQTVRAPENELDEGTLRQVAEITGGRYFRATDFESLKKTYKEIDALEKTDVKTETFSDYRDAHGPFLWAALALVFVDLFLRYGFWRRFP